MICAPLVRVRQTITSCSALTLIVLKAVHAVLGPLMRWLQSCCFEYGTFLHTLASARLQKKTFLPELFDDNIVTSGPL